MVKSAMLNSKIYENTLHMASYRGFEEADDMLAEFRKRPSTEYISGAEYHNIGFDFKRLLKSNLSEYKDRVLMSYVLTDEIRKVKEFTLFGTEHTPFISYFHDILMTCIDIPYKVRFNLVIPKAFSHTSTKESINELSRIFEIFIFKDSSLIKLPFHTLTPLYELMTKAEKEKILSELSISESQMKTISHTDLTLTFLGFSKGNVVRIKRYPVVDGSLLDFSLDYRLIV